MVHANRTLNVQRNWCTPLYSVIASDRFVYTHTNADSSAGAPSVAGYLEPLEAMGDEPPAPDIGQIQIGEWAITRVERQGLGVWVDYVIDVNGRAVVFTSNRYNEPFMRRVVETLSVP